MNVPVSGKVCGAAEAANLQAAIADGVYTSGRWTHQFEKMLREYIGTRFALAVNSGSSANLLAIATLMDKECGENRLQPGDEVITTALNFPTTVNPIVQLGMVPVFIDCRMDMTVGVKEIDAARSDKTKAVILAHALGRPHDIKAIADYCEEHDLWLIEDCCDALGSEVEGVKVGNFGDLATLSFYPAHNITTGEGGCLITESPHLAKIAASLRDWGRDCWCAPGVDNTCGRRFDGAYDHKYTYARLGYNLKTTDLQSAIGCAQMDQVREFNQIRRRNYGLLYYGLLFEQAQLIPLAHGMIPFGFPILTPRAKELVAHLEANGVATRPIFAGNITRQPAYADVKYRVVGELHNTDILHEQAFWIGCWHGLGLEQINYVVEVVRGFFA